MKKYDLHGEWLYTTQDRRDFAEPNWDTAGWETMTLPQNWFLAGLDHHGAAWFRRGFDYDLSAGNYASLRFEGVDYFAEVYLNGQLLGRHSGYFEPFSFDVTAALKPGRNLLALRVESPFEPVGNDGWYLRKRLIKGVLNHHDCRPGGGWEKEGQSYNTGGIWNRVQLLEHGPLTIEHLLLSADLETQPPALRARLNIHNRGAACATRLALDCTPENFQSETQYSATFDLHLPQGLSEHELSISAPGVMLWQPWDRGAPNLYSVSLRLGETQAEERITSFGFRSVSVDSGYNWKVNGQPYFLRGSNYIASQWLAETIFPEVAQQDRHPFPLPPELQLTAKSSLPWFERDVRLARQANLNALRVHAHVLPVEFYTACDRAGILVWQDFPLIWGYTDDLDFQNEAERQMQAMVRLLYNHASIFAWSCHNETPWEAPWMAAQAGLKFDPDHNRKLDRRLQNAARRMDATRYVHLNSGSGDGHAYPGWYEDHWEDYVNLPAAPFPTEYGAQGLPIKSSLLQMFGHFGPDAGHQALAHFKAWMEARPGYGDLNRTPPREAVPPELHRSRLVWAAWRFHDFQPAETFRFDRVRLGKSLDEFIANSQDYQCKLIQFGTEIFRRNKGKITSIIHFMFTDPWPAITWSVLDYWRCPKPAYETLRRSMQPVLPSVELPLEILPGAASAANLCVVNDLRQAFAAARFSWALWDDAGTCLAKGERILDIPGDGVSAKHPISLPALVKGNYQLETALYSAAGEKMGENIYKFSVEEKR